MRILALDLGTKKCGLAISDPLQIIAQPLKTVFYARQDFAVLIDALKTIIEQYEPVVKIILGFPQTNNSKLNPTAKLVLKFVKILKAEWPKLEIVLVDESYSSQRADHLMQTIGLSNKTKKQTRDKLAAQQILEDYLVKNTCGNL